MLDILKIGQLDAYARKLEAYVHLFGESSPLRSLLVRSSRPDRDCAAGRQRTLTCIPFLLNTETTLFGSQIVVFSFPQPDPLAGWVHFSIRVRFSVTLVGAGAVCVEFCGVGLAEIF